MAEKKEKPAVDLSLYKDVWVLLPHNINRSLVGDLPKNIRTYIIDKEDNVEYIWTYIHNKVNENHPGGDIIIGKDCDISEHAIIGIPGNTYAISPEGRRIHLKEIGGVKIGNRVTIAAHSIVHISCFGNTIVEDDVIVCVKCNIGHNTKVGARTYIAPGVLLGGGTQIGADCFIWQGVITHSQIKICDKIQEGWFDYETRKIDVNYITYKKCRIKKPHGKLTDNTYAEIYVCPYIKQTIFSIRENGYPAA